MTAFTSTSRLIWLLTGNSNHPVIGFQIAMAASTGYTPSESRQEISSGSMIRVAKDRLWRVISPDNVAIA
jgi:hypothetical protein